MATPARVLLALGMSMGLAGCDAGLFGRRAPDVTPVNRTAALSHLAASGAANWASGLATNPTLEQLRDNRRAEQHYQLAAVGTNWSAASAGFAGTGATGRISSAPVYFYLTRKVHYLTDTGWLLTRNMTDGTVTATNLFKQDYPADTFPNTALTISSDGKRMYLHSLEGRFYGVDLATGGNIPGSPVNLGGTDADVTAAQVTSPPYIDPLASKPNGTIETVYTLTPTGGLHRMVVTPTGGIVKDQTYTLSRNNTAPYTELFRSSPIVIGGKATIGSWHKHATTSTLDKGYVTYYDTGAAGITTATTSGSTLIKTSVPAPVWAPPAIEFDNALTPKLAFVPTGFSLTMVDLSSGDQAQSVPLLVDKTTVANGNLGSYTYATGAVTTKTLTPDTDGTVSLADTTGLSLPLSGSYRDTANVYAANRYNGTITTPIWGYIKFRLKASDLVVSGTTRSVVDANLRLTCNSGTLAGLLGAAGPRLFRLKTNLLTDVLWAGSSLLPAARPGFADGSPFTLATLASHAASELGTGPTFFFNNGTYTWPAKGLVGTPDRIYTFGMAHEDSPYQPSGFFGFNVAPRFDGGTSPELDLTLSGSSLALPTMSNPVTIDSTRHRIYLANSNALFSISYASTGYDNTANAFTPTAFALRKAALANASVTYFALTRQGRDSLDAPTGDAGPTATVAGSSQYVANVTAPLYTGSYVYVLDNHPSAGRVMLSRFTLATPPVLDQSIRLPNGSGDTRCGSTYMSYDFASDKLFVGTYDTTSGSNGGRAWILTR